VTGAGRRVKSVTSSEAAVSTTPNHTALETPAWSAKTPPISAPSAIDTLNPRVLMDMAASNRSGAPARTRLI